MRDEHFENAHQVRTSTPVYQLNQPDQHDIQFMVVDLILNVDADALDNLKSTVQEANLDWRSRYTILEEIAARGSLCQLRFALLIAPDAYQNENVVASAIKSQNQECFEFLVKENIRKVHGRNYFLHSTCFDTVLCSDSVEMFSIWEKYVKEEIDSLVARGRKKAKVASLYAKLSILSATTGNLHREQLLLDFWNRKGIIEAMDGNYLGSTLTIVAQSCCSVRLATCLIEAGAKVDYRKSNRYMTPLQHAARKTSAEAAELMKFLLERGANPEIEAGRSELRIRDEKGAKGISKWLGVSWDELVEKTKKKTEDMQAGQG